MYQAMIIETLKKNMCDNKDQMDLMRKAKKIFDKFVKQPKQDPRFLDISG